MSIQIYLISLPYIHSSLISKIFIKLSSLIFLFLDFIQAYKQGTPRRGLHVCLKTETFHLIYYTALLSKNATIATTYE